MNELVWFNISVMYSAFSAALAVQVVGPTRIVLVFLTVHGALWAIYRGFKVALNEYHGLQK